MTNTNHNTQNAETTDRSYFNAILSGQGYINRIKLVTPSKGGDSYYSVTICILYGKKDKPNRNYINTIVRGTEALELIENQFSVATDAITNNIPVFGTFEIGDISCETYPKKNGEVGAKMMGRLIGINYLKIGTEVVHQRQKGSVTTEFEATEPAKGETAPQTAKPVETKGQANQAISLTTSSNYGSTSFTYM